MKHLKSVNELFGYEEIKSIFNKKDSNTDDISRCKELSSKLESEDFEVIQQIKRGRIDFFVFFEDNIGMLATLTEKYGIFEIIDGTAKRLNVPESTSKKIYSVIARKYMIKKRPKKTSN